MLCSITRALLPSSLLAGDVRFCNVIILSFILAQAVQGEDIAPAAIAHARKVQFTCAVPPPRMHRRIAMRGFYLSALRSCCAPAHRDQRTALL
eukprot:4811587-Pleurochrysis_carterae.AAC.3